MGRAKKKQKMKKAYRNIIAKPFSVLRFLALFLILSDLPADQHPEERFIMIDNS